jgi:hypothetical protein
MERTLNLLGVGIYTIPEAGRSVPTVILARAMKVERSVERVSRWYDVPIATVRAALEYEHQIAA